MPVPMFETTIWKAAVSPELIDPSTAVFTTLTSGHWTTIEAELSVVAGLGRRARWTRPRSPCWAACRSRPRLSAPLTWMVREAPTPRSPNAHESVFAVIWQSALSSIQATPGRERVGERDGLGDARAGIRDDDRERRGVRRR
jgi:hypothetical protein